MGSTLLLILGVFALIGVLGGRRGSGRHVRRSVSRSFGHFGVRRARRSVFRSLLGLSSRRSRRPYGGRRRPYGGRARGPRRRFR